LLHAEGVKQGVVTIAEEDAGFGGEQEILEKRAVFRKVTTTGNRRAIKKGAFSVFAFEVKELGTDVDTNKFAVTFA